MGDASARKTYYVMVPARGRAVAPVTWPVTHRRHLLCGQAFSQHMLLARGER